MKTDDVKTPGKLGHTLQSRHVTMISFGGIIGAGLFIGSSGAISKGGPGVLMVYALCGLLVFLIMRMLGEMAVAKPGCGSFAEYAAQALGPWAGFVTRWLYWYFWIFTIGAETVAGAKLLHEAGLPGPVWAVGLTLVVIMTVTNLMSVRAYGEVEFWFASLKVSAIGLFIAIGIAYIAVFGPGPHHALVNLLGHGGFIPKGVAGLLAAVPVVIFSMVGSEVATVAAAESADPANNIVKSARTVALRILAFYVVSALVITAIVPWDTVVPGLSPFKAAMDVVGIPGSGQVMSLIILTAVLSCLNSGLYITSRMLYELAKDGDAPRFCTYTASNKTPVVGVLVGCIVGCVAALGQFFMADDVFTLLASTSGDIILVIYIIIAFAQIRQRRQSEAAGIQLTVKMWFFPWLSYAVIAGITGVIVLLAWNPDQLSTLLLSGVTVLVVGVFALLRSKRRRRPDGCDIASRQGQQTNP